MDFQPRQNISSAILAVQTGAKLGLEGLKAFALTRERQEILDDAFDEEYETYDETMNRLASACWMGEAYFTM